MEDRQGRRLVSHAEVERFLRRFGYPPDVIADVLRDAPDPIDVDSDRAREALAKHGISSGALMDQMGASP